MNFEEKESKSIARLDRRGDDSMQLSKDNKIKLVFNKAEIRRYL